MTRRADSLEAGERFYRLTVIGDRKRDARYRYSYLCRCECGEERRVQARHLLNGESKSCGCYSRDILHANTRKHGHARTGRLSPTYVSWRCMNARCRSEGRDYALYGGRGISVCARWANSFEAFLEDMGERPSLKHSLDRIDPNGNYEPGNCRWATALEQIENRRGIPTIEFNGESRTVAQWARHIGISRAALWSRLNAYGWTVERAMTQPVRRWT